MFTFARLSLDFRLNYAFVGCTRLPLPYLHVNLAAGRKQKDKVRLLDDRRPTIQMRTLRQELSLGGESGDSSSGTSQRRRLDNLLRHVGVDVGVDVDVPRDSVQPGGLGSRRLQAYGHRKTHRRETDDCGAPPGGYDGSGGVFVVFGAASRSPNPPARAATGSGSFGGVGQRRLGPTCKDRGCRSLEPGADQS